MFGEGHADLESAAASTSQLFLLLCQTGSLPRISCQYWLGKRRYSLCTSWNAVGPESVVLLLLGSVFFFFKSAPFAVDDERDMVASRSISGGLNLVLVLRGVSRCC